MSVKEIALMALLCLQLIVGGSKNSFAGNVAASDPSTLIFCGGATISINFTLNNLTVNSPNEFHLELSDNNGGFASPIDLNFITSTGLTGTITGVIPEQIISGTAYKFRVIATDVVCAGAPCPTIFDPNSSNVSLNPIPVVTITSLQPSLYICANQSIVLNGVVNYYGSGSNLMNFYWDNSLGSQSISFNWNDPHGSAATSIAHNLFVIEDTYSCSSTVASITLFNNPILTASVVSGSPIDYTPDASSFLQLGGSGGSASGGTPGTNPAYSYSWSPSTALSSVLIPSPSVTLEQLHQNTVYSLEVTDGVGCKATGSVQVNPRNIKIDLTKVLPADFKITSPGLPAPVSGLVSGNLNSIFYLYPKYASIGTHDIKMEIGDNQIAGIKAISVKFSYDNAWKVVANSIKADLYPGTTLSGWKDLDSKFYSVLNNELRIYGNEPDNNNTALVSNLVNGIKFNTAVNQLTLSLPTGLSSSVTGSLQITNMTTSVSVATISLLGNAFVWTPISAPTSGLYSYTVILTQGGVSNNFNGQFIVE